MPDTIHGSEAMQDAGRSAVHILNPEVARKIAAGEVIDRPNAIVRELMDNAVDSGAKRISVEIQGGGIEKIRVADNGCGMTKEDLETCARPHATSKITTEKDLLRLSTLGFRGEALASMAAVGRLSITSGGWNMRASVTEDHVLEAVTPVQGTIVQTAGLFENFPARRVFLKRPASEGTLCRNTFAEKALPRPDIAFIFSADGEEKLNLPAGQTLTERCTEALGFFENPELFYEIGGTSASAENDWSFRLVIGEPSVTRSSRKDIYIYVNGRRITEYALVQAIEYGCQGYFPNGLHPAACLFVTMNPELVDFNIHPAKREARFKDIAPLHHGLSSTVRDFFKQYTVHTMIQGSRDESPEDGEQAPAFDFAAGEQIVNEAPAEETWGKSIAGRYLSPHTVSYDSVSRRVSAGGNNAVSGRAGGTGSTGSNNAGDSSVTDGRSSFFSGRSPRRDSPAAAYAEAVMKDFAQGVESVLGEASVEGRKTKPNYIAGRQEHAAAAQDGAFHFVGSTLGTFLIAEKDDTLYIIDQHAAHERYLYNQIMADAGQKQPLLVPYTIQTENAADDNYIAALADKLEEAGFSCRNCGNGTWEFTAVPIRWKGTQEDLAHDLLDRRINPHDMINAAAASAACRAAVMDGTVLDDKTAAWIAEEALKLPDPHCPHGRPVYTTITRRQLFALVKRI